MTITVQYQQGDFESFDETLRNLLFAQWAAANTATKKPKIISPQGHDGVKLPLTEKKHASDWMRYTNTNLVRVHAGETVRYQPENYQNNFSRLLTTVYIDVFASTPYLGALFCHEIDRIFWEAMPNTSTRIKKANPGTEDSAIETFDRQQIDWRRVPSLEVGDHDNQFAGEIGCSWIKTKTT